MSNIKLVLPDYVAKYFDTAKSKNYSSKELLTNAPESVLRLLNRFMEDVQDYILRSYELGYISAKDADVVVIFPDEKSAKITYLANKTELDFEDCPVARHYLTIEQIAKEDIDNYSVAVSVEDVKLYFPWALQFAKSYTKHLKSRGIANPYDDLIIESAFLD